ncbi:MULTISPECIES: hypothetical protein [Streptomyces]|nr:MULTISPECIES: hypothetical protein [Streptomyces]AUA11727.1 hypothetical protein CFP59_03843 [Streptomyces sp. M56]MYX56554.1 hypothetical protein [Streptomyces sp. SID8382]QDL75481.1 hypothetical protein DNK48_19320 [Streptomyces malaysiensis]
MAFTGVTKRSRGRRAGESAYGLLLIAKNVTMVLVAALILAAGVWSSWGDAKPTMLTKGLERGTVAVSDCDDEWCTGSFTPAEAGGKAHGRVRIDKAVTDGAGDHVAVALKPGTDHAVRTGIAGTLHAWVPFGGSLLLTSLIVAGGLRLRRTGWVMGLLGAALLGASFATLTL